MDFRLTINIDVTDRLEALVRDVISRGAVAVPAAAVAATVETPADEPAPVAIAPEVTAPVDAAPLPAAPVPTPEPDPWAMYTDEYVKGKMDETRRRIEGDDWRTNPGDGEKQKLHRAVTAEFKNIVTTLSASYGDGGAQVENWKDLPPRMREAFVKSLDELIVDETGELTRKTPF